MKGKLYGVGVGPGDPMLMTLRAVEIIKMCHVVAVPSKDRHSCAAYGIAASVVELEGKRCLEIDMPMTRDREKLESCHRQGAQRLEEVLASGQDIAFLTLGDPTVYSTYMYLHQKIAARGYRAEIVSGVPSFCAAAGSLQISLAEQSQQIHIIPAGYAGAEGLSGTKVFMKAGSRLGELKQALMEEEAEVYMVENCGMEQERHYYGAGEMDEQAGYYSVIIAKPGQ